MRIDRPLVLIRERSLLEQLDLAVVVVRQRPWTVAAAAAGGILPFVLLNAALIRLASELADAWAFLALFEAPIATAPLTVVLGGLMFGERPAVGRTIREVFRGLPGLLLFAGLLRGLALLTIVLAPILADRLAFLNEIVLLERTPIRKAWRRAGDLARGASGEGAARGLVLLTFGGLLTLSLWWSLPRFAELLVDRWTLARPDGPLATLGLHLGVWLTVAFSGLARFFGYIDRRIALEGWEIELRLRTAATLMESEADR